MIPKHPTGEKPAAFFHAGLAAYYLIGLYWHAVSAWRHWRDRG